MPDTKKSKGKQAEEKKKEGKKKVELKNFLEDKRVQALNIAIGSKGKTHEQIRDALIVLDEKIVTEEWLDSIYKTCPEPAEYEAVMEFKGMDSELMPSNRYVKAVGVIPRLSARLATMMYRLQFPSLAKDVETEKLEPILSTVIYLAKRELIWNTD